MNVCIEKVKLEDEPKFRGRDAVASVGSPSPELEVVSALATAPMYHAAPFVSKIRLMIDSEVEFVAWGRGGTSLWVQDKERFERHILPKYFHHSNISTFVRQLNNYGFRKVDKDASKFQFEHPCFLKDKPELLLGVKNSRKRRAPKTVEASDQLKKRQIAECEASQLLLNMRYNHQVGVDGGASTSFSRTEIFKVMDMTLSDESLRSQINHSLFDFSDVNTSMNMNTVAKIAREASKMKIGLVNFLDEEKQVMRGNSGLLEHMLTCDREVAICSHVIGKNHSDILVINDLSADDRTKHNPLVLQPPYCKFYAGVPIVYTDRGTKRKVKLGAVCVLDNISHEGPLDQECITTLTLLSKLVAGFIEAQENPI